MLVALKHPASLVCLTIAGNALVHDKQVTDIARAVRGRKEEIGKMEARFDGKLGELKARLNRQFDSLHKALEAVTQGKKDVVKAEKKA